jgi:hypothetical protein
MVAGLLIGLTGNYLMLFHGVHKISNKIDKLGEIQD